MRNWIALPLAIAALLGCVAGAQAELVYGVTLQQRLVTWDSSSPGSIDSGVAIWGMQSNESVVGMDWRPSNGQIYAIGSFNNLYTVNSTTGQLTAVGSAFSVPLDGATFGMDFNPVADAIRVVSSSQQNLRVNPNTASITADTALSYATGDDREGIDPAVAHIAYTGTSSGPTTLYGIDSASDRLVRIDPPNSGSLQTVGSLGAGMDIGELGGFDISPAGTPFAALRSSAGGDSMFYQIDLASGAASLVGQIGGGVIITSMTVVPEPTAALLFGLAVLMLRRR